MITKHPWTQRDGNLPKTKNTGALTVFLSRFRFDTEDKVHGIKG